MRGFIGSRGSHFLLPLDWRRRWLAEGGRVVREAKPEEEPFVGLGPVPLAEVSARVAEAKEKQRMAAKPSPVAKPRQKRGRKPKVVKADGVRKGTR